MRKSKPLPTFGTSVIGLKKTFESFLTSRVPSKELEIFKNQKIENKYVVHLQMKWASQNAVTFNFKVHSYCCFIIVAEFSIAESENRFSNNSPLLENEAEPVKKRRFPHCHIANKNNLSFENARKLSA